MEMPVPQYLKSIERQLMAYFGVLISSVGDNGLVQISRALFVRIGETNWNFLYQILMEMKLKFVKLCFCQHSGLGLIEESHNLFPPNRVWREALFQVMIGEEVLKQKSPHTLIPPSYQPL